MTALPRLALTAAILSACAFDPSAPEGPAPDAAPDAAAPDADPPPVDRRALPSLPFPLVDPHAPQLPAVRRPDLISGSAVRVDGELRIYFMFARIDAEVTTAWARLLDAEDREVEALPPEALAPLTRGMRRAVRMRLALTAERAARVRRVVVFVADARGDRSVELRMDFTDGRIPRAGERCPPDGLIDDCEDGTSCSPTGVCVAPTAPALRSAEGFAAADPARSALHLRWDDPNVDVRALEVATAGRELQVIPLDAAPPGTPAAREGSRTLRFTRDVFAGATRAVLRLRDGAGHVSNALEVTVNAPPLVGADAPCDPAQVTDRCPAGRVCTRYGSLGCSTPSCAPDVAACPSELDTPPLGDPAQGAGPWATTGSTVGVGEARAGVCDRYVGVARIHRFRAPEAGDYAFELTREGEGWGPRLIVRTRCGIGDVGALEATAEPSARSAALTAALTAGQEVWVFANVGHATRYTLGARRVR